MSMEHVLFTPPTDAETFSDRIRREDVSRGDAIKLLVEMVSMLRARNAALLRHIAEARATYDGAATIIRIEDGPHSISLLVWRDAGNALQSVEV